MTHVTYDEYKKSNSEWMGEIPSHWKVNKFKIMFSYFKGRNPQTFSDKPSEGLAPYLSMEYLRNDIDPTYVPVKECPLKANDGDILLLWDGSNAGEFVASKEGVVSSTMAKLIKNVSINHNFSKYVCKAIEPLLRELTIGMGVPHVSSSELNNILLPNIPYNEQILIANYLDKETTKINEIIVKNKELIKLLEEKRTALINQVVTKGLNPEVVMKDSGVEWIGKIPEHYSIIKLKFLTSKIGSGKTPKGGSEIYVSEGIPLLRSQNIHFDSIRLDDVVYITEEINQTMLSTVVKNKDILFNITGASIGRCNYIEDINIANVNQHVCIIRPNKKIFYKYLNYFLQSDCGQNQVFLNQNGTSREGLNFEDLSNFYIILPKDIKEQKTVVSYLEKEIIKIYTTINKVKENIRLLEEYKTSLIHHVVTGKIDVRGEEI